MSGSEGPRELPLIRDGRDLVSHDGKPVRAAGLYRAIPAPAKGAHSPGEAVDHALLVLDDGAEVFLESLGSARARRPESERARFDGRRVAMTGVAQAAMPMAKARLDAYCLSDVRDIAEQD